MNEHIKKFAKNAGFGPKWFEQAPDGYPMLPLQGILENFAEAIVRECAEVAGCNGHVSGFTLSDLIKEHFRVKE